MRCCDSTPKAFTTNESWESQTAPASATPSGLRTTPISTSFSAWASRTSSTRRVPGTSGTAEQTTLAAGNNSVTFALAAAALATSPPSPQAVCGNRGEWTRLHPGSRDLGQPVEVLLVAEPALNPLPVGPGDLGQRHGGLGKVPPDGRQDRVTRANGLLRFSRYHWRNVCLGTAGSSRCLP